MSSTPKLPLIRRYDWLRSNFCEYHAAMAETSSGMCPWCRLEELKKVAGSVLNAHDSMPGPQTSKNLERLRRWLERDDA